MWCEKIKVCEKIAPLTNDQHQPRSVFVLCFMMNKRKEVLTMMIIKRGTGKINYTRLLSYKLIFSALLLVYLKNSFLPKRDILIYSPYNKPLSFWRRFLPLLHSRTILKKYRKIDGNFLLLIDLKHLLDKLWASDVRVLCTRQFLQN